PWDLWEEGWGVHAFTVGAVWAGLDAARGFADLFGDVRAYGRYRDAAERLREASDTNLYSAELGRFPRRITVEDDESVTVDTVLDSAIYGLWRFGMYPADDKRIVDTMKAIAEQLDPHTGAPLSVSPLTWSHAEFIATVDDYCSAAERLRRTAG